MSNSQLEAFRSLHAIIETCKEQMHDDLVTGARGKKEEIFQNHRNKQRIDKIVECTKKVVPSYEDRDKSFRSELDKIRQRGYIHEFYSRFTELRRHHEQNTAIPMLSDNVTFEPTVQFSGEEWNGRFVDLHEFYKHYLNLSVFRSSSKVVHKVDVRDAVTNKLSTRTDSKKVDYKAFITRVFEFWRISNHKKSKAYIEFYEELLEYLVDFWTRTHPITPTKAILKKCEAVFNEEWKNSAVEGWQKPWSKKSKQKFAKSVNLLNELKLASSASKKEHKKDITDSHNNNNTSNSNDEKNGSSRNTGKMEKDCDDENDGDREADDANEDDDLAPPQQQQNGDGDVDMANGDNADNNNKNKEKHEDDDDDDDDDGDDEDEEDVDISLSLKYNHGLYCFACVRKFANLNTLVNGHFKCKKHVAKQAIALLESKVALFADLLSDVVLGAVEYIEKKQTKTYDEIRSELEEAERDDEYEETYGRKRGGYDSDEADDDPSILNPLQIPLDFDGKPIPYWLYKFRGLNRYFDCEICDTRYRGPRAFERHFREWKHAHCMRILNIPNTKDFHMITKREDAELLHRKIQQMKMAKSWNPEHEEEFEDNDGNVFKKSMYDQLKKQGVI